MQEHPAYWLLRSLNSQISSPEWFINIRAIVNLPPTEVNGKMVKGMTRVTFNENIKVSDFKNRWYGDLQQRLTLLNQSEHEPSNIYYGVNPRLNGNSSSNKLADVAGYLAFYLDCDDNKSMTKDQRLIQIQFWADYGLEPSINVCSGNGYHVYWCLNRLEPVTQQIVLKKMVMLAGCRDKGNTHDATRILRLPGFYNVKNWWDNGARPLCTLITPTDPTEPVQRYDAETFNAWFPPSELENIEDYHRRAVALGEGIPFNERVRALAQAAVQAKFSQQLQADGIAIADQNDAITGTSQFAERAAQLPGQASPVIKERFTPTRKVVPNIEDIKWPKGKTWMRKYCMTGYEGMTLAQRDDLCAQLNTDAISASEIDEKVICCLISMGYTFEAVQEFWGRLTLKLYREEKFQKNKNYLQISYDKALEYVRSSIEQHDKSLTSTGHKHKSIIVDQCQTMLVLTSGAIETVITGEFILRGKYYDEDALYQTDREWFDIRCYVKANGQVQHFDRVMPGEAFSSIAAFKRWGCGEFLRVVTDSASALQCLLKYLEDKYPNVPTQKFHSKIMYKSGAFLFPHYTVRKDGPELKEDNSMLETLKERFPVYKWFDPTFLKTADIEPFLRKNWVSLLHFHLPRVVLSVMGSIASAALKPILEDKLKLTDFNLPTLNIRGSSHSGKSETVRKLCKLAGVIDGKNVVSTESTMFALQRQLESTNFIPMIIDEFKQTEHNHKNIENIRSIVRRIYSGEVMTRGRANLDVVTFRLNGALIVVGEHALERVGDVSEISRVIPISTDEYEPDKHIDEYFHVTEAHWEWLAPQFYASILQLDHAAIYEEFKQLRLEIIGNLKYAFTGEKLRVGHNLATVWLGCRLWDKFVQKHAPGLPTLEKELDINTNLVEYVKKWAVESEQTLLSTSKVSGDTNVTANNELFKMLKTFSELKVSGHKLLTDFAGAFTDEENKKEDTVCFKLGSIYEIYSEYCAKTRVLPPPKEKIFALAKAAIQRKEEWILEYNKSMKKNHYVHKVVVARLSSLCDMKIWQLYDKDNTKTIRDGPAP